MSVDSRGVTRGCCNAPGCSCSSYAWKNSSGMKCDKCGHPPGKHAKTSMTTVPTAVQSVSDDELLVSDSGSDDEPTSQPITLSSMRFPSDVTEVSPPRPPRPRPSSSRTSPKWASRDAWSAPRSAPRPKRTSLAHVCRYPNCSAPSFFDLNTREESVYCETHMSSRSPVAIHTEQSLNHAVFLTDGDSEPMMLSQQSTHVGTIDLLTESLPSQFHTVPRQSSNVPLPTPRLVKTEQQLFHPSQSAPNLRPVPIQRRAQPVALLPDDQRCKYPYCNKGRYQEGHRTHDFCGIKHAREYERGAEAMPVEGKCKTAGCTRCRRAREDGNGYYDYCGKSCRDGSFQKATSSTPGELCSLPECDKPKYVDPANGRVHDYCGRTHANQAQAQGITPQVCTFKLLGLSELAQVQAHFQKEWKKGACPPITCIIQVTNSQLETRWNAYKQKLPRGYQTSERHFHGTKLKCDIANSPSLQPCTEKDCGICGICKFGMYRECIRKNINFQRFGHGFYFAPNSSKCHDYTQGVLKHRAMLLVDILPGNKHVILSNDQNLKGPPDGCHSVYGQPGQALNYAELVVYNPDCVMPRYIIVYVLNGVHKIAQ